MSVLEQLEQLTGRNASHLHTNDSPDLQWHQNATTAEAEHAACTRSTYYLLYSQATAADDAGTTIYTVAPDGHSVWLLTHRDQY